MLVFLFRYRLRDERLLIIIITIDLFAPTNNKQGSHRFLQDADVPAYTPPPYMPGSQRLLVDSAAPIAAPAAAGSYQAKTDAVKSLEARSMRNAGAGRYLRRGD